MLCMKVMEICSCQCSLISTFGGFCRALLAMNGARPPLVLQLVICRYVQWFEATCILHKLELAVQHTQVRSICPIHFSRDQSSNKLISFTLETQNWKLWARDKIFWNKIIWESTCKPQEAINLLMSGAVFIIMLLLAWLNNLLITYRKWPCRAVNEI